MIFARMIFICCILTSTCGVPLKAETLERADGSNITYNLARNAGQQQRSIILMLQGSGCDPVIERDWLASEPQIVAPSSSVLTIEKYGVVVGRIPPSPEPMDECSVAYWSKNTLQQRVLDAVQVIAHMRREPWWNGELIIYGGSEGGAVAALLAPLIPETRAVVVVSSGIGVSVADLISSAVPPQVAAQIPKILEEARANPTATLQFGGASYRWWADSADVIPAKALLQTNVPILLIHGTKDQFAPVDTARATRDMMQQAGKANFTYLELEGYDHFMVDKRGVDHKEDVLRDVAGWISSH